MKPRQNQPVRNPRGGFGYPHAGRVATTSGHGKPTIRFAMSLPPGVLVRLLARQNRLMRANSKTWSVQGSFSLPKADKISRLKFLP